MKVLFVLAILFAVAHARLQTLITYNNGSADCSDPTKIVFVHVIDEQVNGDCIDGPCTNDTTQPILIRCYDNIGDVPIPENVVTMYQYEYENCTGELLAARYQLVGLPGCRPIDDASSYFPSCNSTAVCSGNDCSSCHNFDIPELCFSSTKYFCGADKSVFPAAPVSSPVSAPVFSPTGSAAPQSTPTGTSTPAKKSFASSLQVVCGVSAAVLVAVALVA